ncbi:hypothetical protein [Jeotgalibacillus proteolyticus]|uniref:hypothetical protein n=1 Tax=Jeotgalibacillus proteolyticus TaxID=2082395 RepID=UPI003CF8B586
MAGIISGAAATIINIQLQRLENSLYTGLISVVAALTIGGKALGESLFIKFSRNNIFQVGKTLQFVEEKLHIVIIKDTKKIKSKNQQDN